MFNIFRGPPGPPTTTEPPRPGCDTEPEIKKIKCLNESEHEIPYGGYLKYTHARMRSDDLFELAGKVIVKEEAKKLLNLPPPPPWTNYKEITNASTLDAYFEMRNGGGRELSLDNNEFFEKNVRAAVKLIDERAPVIRTVAKCLLEDVIGTDMVDRLTIGRIADEQRWRIEPKMRRAIRRLAELYCHDDDDDEEPTTTPKPVKKAKKPKKSG
uniref:DUF4145 domain-containing protein n=1 Tax=Caenorhabditis tropicalis TaxID=1561998 RepID=A0A1I7UJ61_9PELO